MKTSKKAMKKLRYESANGQQPQLAWPGALPTHRKATVDHIVSFALSALLFVKKNLSQTTPLWWKAVPTDESGIT